MDGDLMRNSLLSCVGTQWPKCFLHCGWIEHVPPNPFVPTHRLSGASVHSYNTTPSTYSTFFPSHQYILTFIMCTAARRRLTFLVDVQSRLIQPTKPVIWEPKNKYIYIYIYIYLFLFKYMFLNMYVCKFRFSCNILIYPITVPTWNKLYGIDY